MNKNRRERIDEANGLVTHALQILREVVDEESEALEGVPDTFETKRERMETDIDALQEATDNLEATESLLQQTVDGGD